MDTPHHDDPVVPTKTAIKRKRRIGVAIWVFVASFAGFMVGERLIGTGPTLVVAGSLMAVFLWLVALDFFTAR